MVVIVMVGHIAWLTAARPFGSAVPDYNPRDIANTITPESSGAGFEDERMRS
jgi:hypothetical protein